MLAIKLRTVGKKHQRSFRVVVQEKKAKLQGKFVEDLGWYNPHTNAHKIDAERVSYWVKAGAQPTKTVTDLLKKGRKGTMEKPQEKKAAEKGTRKKVEKK